MHNVHPDIMLLLMNQRTNEAREAAQRFRIARTARTARKLARRDPAGSAFAVPEIPDYVDAMFGNTTAGNTTAGSTVTDTTVTGADGKSECRDGGSNYRSR
jgi:hypothetical protein